MSDKFRYFQGDTNPVASKPVQSALLIEIGDLVYQDMLTKDVYPASSMPDQGGDIPNQRLFQCWFLGVALQRSRVGDTKSIMVGTTGEYEFICASNTWELGDLIAPDGNAAANGLLDQTVEEVYASDRAIGVCAQREPTANTRVIARIKSTVMGNGIHEDTCSGSSSSGS